MRLDVQHPGPGESGFTHPQVPRWARLGTGWEKWFSHKITQKKWEHFVVKVCWTLMFKDFYWVYMVYPLVASF